MRLSRPILGLGAVLALTLATVAVPSRKVRAGVLGATYSFSFVDNRSITVNGEPAVDGAEYSGGDVVEVTTGSTDPGSFTMTQTGSDGVSESKTSDSLLDPTSCDAAWEDTAIWIDPDTAIWIDP